MKKELGWCSGKCSALVRTGAPEDFQRNESKKEQIKIHKSGLGGLQV